MCQQQRAIYTARMGQKHSVGTLTGNGARKHDGEQAGAHRVGPRKQDLNDPLKKHHRRGDRQTGRSSQCT